MKYNLNSVIGLACLFLLFQSCGHRSAGAANAGSARFTSDSSIFAVDESLQPIVDEELYIFKALNNKAHPQIVYAPENTIINLLMSDSLRFALTSRDLTANEKQVLVSHQLQPSVNRFAIDAIAIIVNKASNDTTITVSEIKKMLNGQAKQDKNIIFDNPNSGLVRYLKEFSGNSNLQQKNIFSLKSNKEVIKYVAAHPNAIGITGFGWLNDPAKDYADAVDNVKIVGVKDDTGKNPTGQYFTPSQTTLALNQYPLTRNLYIVNCTGHMSLGMEFEFFVRGDQGQRIIVRSGLLPDNIPDRQVSIVTK
jgi:phosphate transport system substrate-binding protein